MGNSFIKIDEKYAAALSYAFGAISGCIFYVGETASGNNNNYVKFNGLQSIMVFGGAEIIIFILRMFKFIPFMGLLITAVGFAVMAAKIILILMALRGKVVKIPYVGNICYYQFFR